MVIRSVRRIALLVALMVFGVAAAAAPTSEQVSFRNGDVTLRGTLALPAGAGPHPAVVLVSGSGPQDRDGGIPGIAGYRPFAEISDALVAEGIAVLRYDDRGAGASSGDNLTATTADLAEDASAALRYLMGRQDIDALQLGIVGHSEGALIAPMLAARDPAVAFIVVLGPPVADPIEGLVTQEERIVRATGAPEAAVAEAAALARRSLELNAAGDWPVLEALLRETVRAQLRAMPAEQRSQFGDLEQAEDKLITTAMAQQRTWMHWFVTHDPSVYWRAVRVPVLAVFGGKDVQVDEAQHRGALAADVADLPAGARQQVRIVEIPEANHLFLKADSGGVQEYGNLDPHLMPELLDLLRTWVPEQVALPGSAGHPTGVS